MLLIVGWSAILEVVGRFGMAHVGTERDIFIACYQNICIVFLQLAPGAGTM